MGDYARDVLVTTDWVADHLEDDTIRIVEVDENPSLYAEAHIPGAIGFDWQQDLQDQERRDFLGAEDFGALMGSRGISNDHTVVLYGDRNNWFAAYTYWYFRYYGHDAVKLMNGVRARSGSARIVRARRDVPAHPAATYTVARSDESIRARRERGRGRSRIRRRSSSTCGARRSSPARCISADGYAHEGAQRGGHIPGAASSLGAGGRRGRHLQVGRTSCGSSTPTRA